MQKRIITPYPGAPDLSAYEDEDLDSAFSPKPETEVDHSCRYTNRTAEYLHIDSYCVLSWVSQQSLKLLPLSRFRALCVYRPIKLYNIDSH